MTSEPAPLIAIACGGTGGHLFPGLAVAERLRRRGCGVVLLVSPKEVDQEAVKMASGVEIVTLPAVGLSRGRRIAFLRGFVESYRVARKQFKNRPPHAALAMGGFTSAPPILAAERLGARVFLHESNTIPGRANRWLSRVVDQAFVGFPQAASRLRARHVTVTGTPVRAQFRSLDPALCRAKLKLFGVSPSGGPGQPPGDGTLNQGTNVPAPPVLLVMGGSQGASGINELVINALPLLAPVTRRPCSGCAELQLLHLSGPKDAEKIRQACAALNVKAVVHPFLAEMELALGAATLAISRAGASSLAELAAMRVPAILIPFPAATGNHQFHNARAFAETGAARLLEPGSATPATLARVVWELMADVSAREAMQTALARWHAPQAAEQIAEQIISAVVRSADLRARAGKCAGEAGAQGGSRAGATERHQLSSA